jgi:hypothetical protein
MQMNDRDGKHHNKLRRDKKKKIVTISAPWQRMLLASILLFGTALIGLVGFSKRRKAA